MESVMCFGQGLSSVIAFVCPIASCDRAFNNKSNMQRHHRGHSKSLKQRLQEENKVLTVVCDSSSDSGSDYPAESERSSSTSSS